MSLLDSGRQSGELKWNAEVEQGWSEEKPKWASGGGVPLTGDWLEPDPDAGDGTLAGDPEAIPDVIAQTSFAPKKTATVADATASLLLEDAKNLLPHLLWSSDQNAFFALTQAGALHRVALDGFRETHRVRLFEEASAMAQSAMGLVVAVPGSQLVRVIAEDGLRTLRTIRVPGVSQLVSSPQLKVAYAADERSPWELSVVDLHRKRVARTYAAREVSQRFRHLIRRHPDGVVLSEFDALTVSPDGKYLFAEGFECLHRFRIKGTSLEYEEMGPRLGTGRIEISPDSKYLTMVGSLSSNAIKNHPRIKQGSLPIYRLENLQDPVRVVEVGIHPRALGFDVARGRLLGHDHNRPLLVLGSRSEPEREYALPVARNSRVRQILPHPVYSGALVLTDKELWWVGWG